MKRNFRILIIAAFLLVPLMMPAQKPPHPGGGKPPGTPGNGPPPKPVGAPVGSGTYILFTLAAAYAGRKAYGLRTTTAEV